jgi:U3 small nucleolar RNA-associated protein MPP10
MIFLYSYQLVIQSSVPAIQMEEIIPLSVSNTMLTAPEEVLAKKKGRDGLLRSQEELSSQERNAARLAKKTAKRKHLKEKKAGEKLIEKINPGMGNKYSKEKMREALSQRNVKAGKKLDDTSSFGNSGKFFSKLSQQVSSEIAGFKKEKSNKVSGITNKGSQLKL